MSTDLELCRDAELSIRPMRDDRADYDLIVRWRNEPHVAEWWSTDDDPTPTTFDHVVEAYGPRSKDAAWSTDCIIAVGDRPIGYTQFYPWSAVADEAREMGVPDVDGSYGLDIFIGEPDMVGRGMGSRAVALLSRHLFEAHCATAVALLTPVGNARAHRAYEKAGFRKVKQTLDTDVVNGERRMSWLMVLERPLG
ncbi:MAG: GNAT family N-acetyltransferase [Actinomycetota bacterium]